MHLDTTHPVKIHGAAGMRGIIGPMLRVTLFAVLLWLGTAAGTIHIPGTPVPITLQTFVLMLAGLTLTWREAGSAVLLYLLAGAVGLPVFASGASTLALIGPSAGFLLGFLPGVILTAMLKGRSPARLSDDERPDRRFVRQGKLALRYALASIIGCVLVVYAFGAGLQSAITGIPLGTVALATTGFIIGDMIKATVAALAVSAIDGMAEAR